MNENKPDNKKDNLNKRWTLPFRVVIISTCITLIGMFGMAMLGYYLDDIIREYDMVVEKEYNNLQNITTLSNMFYSHRTLTYQYMNFLGNNDECEKIERDAKNIEEQMTSLNRDISNSVRGTGYEAPYHSLSSAINSYFKNVAYIYDFTNAGDAATAKYYMDNMLDEDIDSIERCVKEVSGIISGNVKLTQSNMINRMRLYRTASQVLVYFLAIFSVIALFRCIRITYDIVNRDALTQIYNMDALQTYVSKLYKKGKLIGYVCVCTNIKGLSLINRNMGTNIGDLVVIGYAQKISKYVGKDEYVARIGGDNFIFYVKEGNVHDLLDKLSSIEIDVVDGDITKSFTLESRCGLYSVGSNDRFAVVIDAAYLALQKAKNAGKGDVVWFDNDIMKKTYDEKHIVLRYRKALDNKEFVPYYQPKVNAKDRTLVGGEALVRWLSGGKLIPPDEFIPAIEKDGTITELDFYVFESVCADIRKWIDEKISPVPISVNFSKLHLKKENFAQKLIDIIEKYQVPRNCVEIELTESSGYENFEALKRFCKTMKEQNIKVSIDDFGTGYSSLSLIKDIDVDIIKLDKSFIDGIGMDNPDNDRFVTNVIHMIKDLNRDIVSEGVESSEQVKFLLDEECNVVQGYLFDMPLPKADFEMRLHNPNYNQK